jgi:hypothetical protein
MEYGGAGWCDGDLPLRGVDGNLLDTVAKDGTVLATSTFGRFRLGRLR